MSPEAVTGVFTLAGVAFGGIVTLAGEQLLYRRQRDDALNDRLYRERSTAYIQFVQAAHECAHGVGNLAFHSDLGDPERALPSPDERVELSRLPDVFAAKQVRVVEVVGPPDVAEAARNVQGALYRFRNVLLEALAEGTPLEYWGERYLEEYTPLRDARTKFVEAAKTHLARLSARSDS